MAIVDIDVEPVVACRNVPSYADMFFSMLSEGKLHCVGPRPAALDISVLNGFYSRQPFCQDLRSGEARRKAPMFSYVSCIFVLNNVHMQGYRVSPWNARLTTGAFYILRPSITPNRNRMYNAPDPTILAGMPLRVCSRCRADGR